MIRLSLNAVHDLASSALLAGGVSLEHAGAIADVVTTAEADECASHGLHRIPGYIGTARSGAVDPEATPRILCGEGVVVQVDASRGFAPLAVKTGRPILAELARKNGVAALAVSNCAHFSALWCDVEPLGTAGFAALAFTIGQRRVALPGGKAPVVGTNPIAFAWPRKSALPFVFDFATSVVARGEIELRADRGETLPENWAIDDTGNPTLDPIAALAGALLPFGGYKGAALAIMVELLAGALTGEVAARVAPNDKTPRLGGTLILALDPSHFDPAALATADRTFGLLRGDGNTRLPSERRYAARERTAREGVLVPVRLHEEIVGLASG